MVVWNLVKKAFRSAEQFVKGQIRPGLVDMSEKELDLLKGPLMNGGEWLPADQMLALNNLIKINLNLATVVINPDYVDKLIANCHYQLHHALSIQHLTHSLPSQHHSSDTLSRHSQIKQPHNP